MTFSLLLLQRKYWYFMVLYNRWWQTRQNWHFRNSDKRMMQSLSAPISQRSNQTFPSSTTVPMKPKRHRQSECINAVAVYSLITVLGTIYRSAYQLLTGARVVQETSLASWRRIWHRTVHNSSEKWSTARKKSLEISLMFFHMLCIPCRIIYEHKQIIIDSMRKAVQLWRTRLCEVHLWLVQVCEISTEVFMFQIKQEVILAVLLQSHL